jgi:hypothetical protein
VIIYFLINLLRGTLLLFHPFRNEYKEITSQDLRIKYEKIEQDELQHERLQSQIAYFQPYQDLLNGIESYIKEHQDDEDHEENENYEDDASEIEGDEDLELETTEMKDIKDFIKNSKKEIERETGLMEKKALLERICMLNLQQRQIFDDIISRLMSGNFEDNQFLIYIR